MNLSGKVGVVTGAGNGIGRAIAGRFAREGMRVALLDVDRDAVERAAGELSSQTETLALECDISRRGDVAAAVAAVAAKFGALDVLAANAAIGDAHHFLDIDDRAWDRIIGINLTGAFYCIQEAARVMAERGGGAIVVTSSTNAWYVEANLAAYNASKGGVVALMRSAALDLARFGIRVNAVEPSMVKTRAAFITQDPIGGPEYLKRVPLGRFAEPDEIANAVTFLASSEASYITGHTIVLDGGLTLGIEMPMPAEPLPGSARAVDAAP